MRKVTWIEILTLLYVLLIAYGTLMPFDVSFAADPDPLPSFLGLPLCDTGLPDVMSNILLYMPLGLLGTAFLRRRGIRGLANAVIVVSYAIVTAYALETAQTVLASRVASFPDAVCNVIGTIMGVAFAIPNSIITGKLTPALNREIRRDPTAVLAGIWVIVLGVAALAPLDLTFDVSIIMDGAREADLVPFARHQRLADWAFGQFNEAAHVDLWQLRLDYVSDVFLHFMLSVLLIRNMIAWRFDSATAKSVSGSASVLFGILLTVLAVFVRSVPLDVTHMLTRGMGGVLGAWANHWAMRGAMGRVDAEPDELRRATTRFLKGSIVIAVAYIGMRQLAPFELSSRGLRESIAGIEWLPMASYTFAKLPNALLDAMHKSFRYLWLGTLVGLLFRVSGRRVRLESCMTFAAVWAAVTTATEIAQCLLPARVPSMTDIIIAGIGAATGMLIGSALFDRYAQSSTQTFVASDRVILNVEIPLPNPDAPTESAQTDRKTRRPHRV